VKISIIIPVYNEAATIHEVLQRVRSSPLEKEIVIVDDPSLAAIYEARLVLVRPDTHVAWRGNSCDDGDAVWAKVLQ